MKTEKEIQDKIKEIKKNEKTFNLLFFTVTISNSQIKHDVNLLEWVLK
jgi:SMC interacting uncharacterized protein involved in chromosome segregation